MLHYYMYINMLHILCIIIKIEPNLHSFQSLQLVSEDGLFCQDRWLPSLPADRLATF